MSKRTVYLLWAGLFILCAGLSFIPEPTGTVKYLLTGLSLVFFLPPAWLIHTGDRLQLQLVRNLAALSLGLTVLSLLGNFFSLMAPEALGNLLYVILVMVSVPMVCSGYWAVSLFLWTCLLLSARKKLKQ